MQGFFLLFDPNFRLSRVDQLLKGQIAERGIEGFYDDEKLLSFDGGCLFFECGGRVWL